jgi:hypothetical protein
MMSKKYITLGVATITGFGLIAADYANLLGRKEEKLVEVVIDGLKNLHYQPEKINDDFSLRVYDLFLKDMDREKRFYTKTDINKLEKYKTLIDNEVVDGTFGCYTLATKLGEERIKQVEGWYKELLAQPFDFKTDETYETNYEKRDYAANDEELKEMWRKALKFQTMNRIADMMDEDEKAAETAAKEKKEFSARKFEDLEAEARKKVLKSHDDWFKRLKKLKPEDEFALYLNALTGSYDPHTNYFAPQAKEDFDVSMSEN